MIMESNIRFRKFTQMKKLVFLILMTLFLQQCAQKKVDLTKQPEQKRNYFIDYKPKYESQTNFYK